MLTTGADVTRALWIRGEKQDQGVRRHYLGSKVSQVGSPVHGDREIFRGTGGRADGNAVSSGNGPWARPLNRRIEGRRPRCATWGSKNSSSAWRQPVTGASNPRAVLRNVLLTEATPITEGSAHRRIKTRCSSAPANFNPIEGLSSGNSGAIKCPACSGDNELVS